MEASELKTRIDRIAPNGWVCPQPMRWHEIYETLPGRVRNGLGWNLPLPLILAAWWEASPQQKRERFLVHVKWAERHGMLDSVLDALSEMADEDWYLGD